MVRRRRNRYYWCSGQAGVKGINLKEEDYVIGVKVLAKDSDEMIAIVTQRGSVKKMKLSEFEKTSRANEELLCYEN